MGRVKLTVAFALLSSAALAQHKTLEDGKKAAEKSKKPILLVTLWAAGNDPICDKWKAQVLGDEAVKEPLAKYEWVEWEYDGVDGAVIKWTKAHGNTNDEPSYLVWVLNVKEEVFAEPGATARSVESFSSWLTTTAEDFVATGGGKLKTMKVEFAEATYQEEGGATVLMGLKAAKEGGMPALLYFYIPASFDKDKKLGDDAKRCRKLEGGAMGDEKVGETASNFLCVKIDLTTDKGKKVAGDYKVKEGPTLVILDWKAKTPKTITNAATGAKELLEALKKVLPKETPEENP